MTDGLRRPNGSFGSEKDSLDGPTPPLVYCSYKGLSIWRCGIWDCLIKKKNHLYFVKRVDKKLKRCTINVLMELFVMIVFHEQDMEYQKAPIKRRMLLSEL